MVTDGVPPHLADRTTAHNRPIADTDVDTDADMLKVIKVKVTVTDSATIRTLQQMQL